MFVEMEGRGSSDFYRNTSEELFIKTMMEGSIGMPVPTMEMLGFKNLSQNFRTDSEELFKSWLNNGESNAFNSPSTAYRTRQASRRMSSELTILPCQQSGDLLQKKRSNDNLIPENTSTIDHSSSDIGQHSIRNAVEQELQAGNLFLEKAWFHSSQPMTRSRSSELRRRYAAMQNSHAPMAMTPLGTEGMNNVSGPGMNNLKQEFSNVNGLNDPSMCEIANQFSSFMSPSNSSSSNFNTPHVAVDGISSVVSMLKGTLEHKKLSKKMTLEACTYSSLGSYGTEEVLDKSCLNQENNIHDVSTIQIKDTGYMQTIGGALDINMEGFLAPANFIPLGKGSREPSQSESSAAAPAISAPFDVCDGQSIPSQPLNICQSSRKQVGNGQGTEDGSRSKNIRERIYDKIKDNKKQKASLVRYGSMTSASSVEKGDSTKKRRVERSRKMAEAKERNLTPAIPSDMQSIVKRCENLEKEVRSLKLNLAFMNRKDSEQA